MAALAKRRQRPFPACCSRPRNSVAGPWARQRPMPWPQGRQGRRRLPCPAERQKTNHGRVKVGPVQRQPAGRRAGRHRRIDPRPGSLRKRRGHRAGRRKEPASADRHAGADRQDLEDDRIPRSRREGQAEMPPAGFFFQASPAVPSAGPSRRGRQTQKLPPDGETRAGRPPGAGGHPADGRSGEDGRKNGTSGRVNWPTRSVPACRPANCPMARSGCRPCKKPAEERADKPWPPT